MGALRELAAILGIEVEGEDKVKDADEKVGSLIDRLKEVGEVVAEAFAWEKAKEFVEGQVEAATEIERTSQVLGIATEALETWRFAAADAGVSADAMTMGLRHLNLAISLAASGSAQHAAVFDKLGIKLKDATGKTRAMNDIVGELADKIAATTDPTKKSEIAFELLGKQGALLLPLLNKGRDAFAEASEQLDELGGTTSPQFIEAAKKIEEQQNRLNVVMGNFKQTIAFAIFPTFTKLIEYATRWTKAAMDFAKQTTILQTGLEALAVVAAFKTAASLFALGQKMGLLKPTAVETVAALGRFAIPLAIIAALYLIFDELFNLFSDNHSVIGDVLDEFGGLGTAEAVALHLTDIFGNLYDILRDIGAIIGRSVIAQVRALLAELGGVGKALAALATGHFADAVKAYQSAGDEAERIEEEAGNRNAADAKDLGGAVLFSHVHHTARQAQRLAFKRQYGAKLEAMGPDFSGPIFVPQSGVLPPGAQPAAGAAQAPIVVHQQNHNEVKITTADKPKPIGEAAASGTASGVQKANNNTWNAPVTRKR